MHRFMWHSGQWYLVLRLKIRPQLSTLFQQKLQPRAGPGRRAGQWPDLLTGSPSSKDEPLADEPSSSDMDSSLEKLLDNSVLPSFFRCLCAVLGSFELGWIKSIMKVRLVLVSSLEVVRSGTAWMIWNTVSCFTPWITLLCWPGAGVEFCRLITGFPDVILPVGVRVCVGSAGWDICLTNWFPTDREVVDDGGCDDSVLGTLRSVADWVGDITTVDKDVKDGLKLVEEVDVEDKEPVETITGCSSSSCAEVSWWFGECGGGLEGGVGEHWLTLTIGRLDTWSGWCWGEFSRVGVVRLSNEAWTGLPSRLEVLESLLSLPGSLLPYGPPASRCPGLGSLSSRLIRGCLMSGRPLRLLSPMAVSGTQNADDCFGVTNYNTVMSCKDEDALSFSSGSMKVNKEPQLNKLCCIETLRMRLQCEELNTSLPV